MPRERLAHTLKGVAASIGAADLGELAGRLESDCGNDGAAEGSIAALAGRGGGRFDCGACTRLSRRGTALSKRWPTRPGRQADPQQVTRAASEQLRQTLGDCDTQHSSRVAEELSRAREQQGAQQQAMQAVVAHVEAFDFDEALVALQAVEEMLEADDSRDD